MSIGDLTLAADSTQPLTCGRCRATAVPRLIRPYWTPPGGRALCPNCCEAACHHYEALEDGWPADLDTGRRPPKLADIQAFYTAHRRFPQDAELADDGTITWPDPPPEETPEW